MPDPHARDDDDDYDRRYAMRYRRSPDEEHLRILSILHYVFGGLAAFYCSIPLVHVCIGALLAAGVMSHNPEDALVGWIMLSVASAIVLLGWAFAGCTLYAGYCLSRRKHYLFCFVMACLACTHMPLGTILGVFTIIVLARPGVKELFERPRREPQPAAEA